MLKDHIQSAARLFRYVGEISGNRSGAAIRPRLLTHTVTFRCNARCVMCDSWRLEREDELSLAEIDAFYSSLPRLDALRLTGGEPFVRKDLAEIAHLGAERLDPRIVHITTNGFLTDRIVDFARGWDRSASLHVLVSLDGLEERHDSIRGVPKSYERTMATLRELSELKRSGRIRLAVNQTVLDGEGAAEYPALRDELQKLGVPLHVVVAYKESATYSLERDRDVATDLRGGFDTFGAFSPAEILGLLDELEDDLGRLPLPERQAKAYYVAGLRKRLLGESGPAAPSCAALHSHLRLFPSGDIPTCQNNSQIVGNVREQTFAEIWESAATVAQRRWVKACAGCWAECEVLPSAIYSGDLPAFALRRTFRRPALAVSRLHSL